MPVYKNCQVTPYLHITRVAEVPKSRNAKTYFEIYPLGKCEKVPLILG